MRTVKETPTLLFCVSWRLDFTHRKMAEMTDSATHKHVRPSDSGLTAGHIASREVRMRATIIRLLDIDLQAQTFTCTIRLEASWLEDELNEVAKASKIKIADLKVRTDQHNVPVGLENGSYKYIIIETHDGEAYPKNAKPKRFFAPRLKLRNCIREEKVETWFRIYQGKGVNFRGQTSVGIVCQRFEVTGTFQEQMELQLFPWDTQFLNIQVESGWECDVQSEGNLKAVEQVLLVKNKNEAYASKVNTADFVQQSSYFLYDRLNVQEGRKTPAEHSAGNQQYPLLTFTMRVDRKAGYWLWNVLSPVFIIMTSISSIWSVPADDIGDRCSIIVTVMLAVVAFKFIITDKLPNISYGTLVDKYVFACFLFAFGSLVCQALLQMGLIEESFLERPINLTSSVNSTLSDKGTRTVKIPIFLFWNLGIWLGGHLLCALALRAKFANRSQDDKRFWSVPMTSCWVGPLHEECATSPDDANATAIMIKKTLMMFKSEDGGPRYNIEDVIVWSPDAAKETVDNSRVIASEASATQPALNRSRSRWSAPFHGLKQLSMRKQHHESASSAYTSPWLSGVKRGKEKELMEGEEYRGLRPFAVIRFSDEGSTARFLYDGAKMLDKAVTSDGKSKLIYTNKGDPDSLYYETRVEYLNLAFIALSNRKTFLRGVAQVAKTSICRIFLYLLGIGA